MLEDRIPLFDKIKAPCHWKDTLPPFRKIEASIKKRKPTVRTEWRFWPSEASCVTPKGKVIGKCIRRIYYEWQGTKVTNPVDTFVEILGEIGNLLEESTREELKIKKIYSEKLNEKSNRKFRTDLFKDSVLSAEIDILVADHKEYCGIENKSYSNSTHKMVVAPKDAHLLQTFLYLMYYKPYQPYFVIYYKPSQLPIMGKIYATEKIWFRIDSFMTSGHTYPVINGVVDRRITLDGIVNRYKEAKYYVENDSLPCREFTKSSKDCSQCQYHTLCWSDKMGSRIE